MDKTKEGIKFSFLPIQIRFLIRDFILHLNKLNQSFANLFIRPIKLKETKSLKEEIRKNKVKKVLIIRNDRIGDAILSIKVINNLSKIFKETYVLSSDQNFEILKEETNAIIIKENQYRNFEPFDLIIDFNGSMANNKIQTKYKIGFNRGIFSIFYSNFYPYNLTESKMQYIDAMKDLIYYCLGIKLNVEDLPPKDFKKEKKNQVFIFVGNKPNRQLPYEKWKELILLSANKNKTIVADDPDQLIMNKLKLDKEILENKNIKLITEPKSLKDLAKIANDSKLFIALDGGAEHYLERYTNAIVIYTCGYPDNWKPYTLNKWKYKMLGDHVIGESKTSIDLKKYIFYRVPNRKPCYDLVCDYDMLILFNSYLKEFFYIT